MSHDEQPVIDVPGEAIAAVTVDAPVAVAGVGDRLRAAREARGLSVADVSQTIKISPRVLEQVEGNAWGQLAGHTFARGVVRSYAKLVHIDPEPLLKELESAPLPKRPLLELPRSTDAALPIPGDANKRDRLAMVSGVLLVAMAVVAYYLIPEEWFGNTGKPANSRQVVSVSAPPVDRLPIATTPGALPSVLPAAPPPEAVPVQAAAPVAPPVATPVAPVAAAPVAPAAAAPVTSPSLPLPVAGHSPAGPRSSPLVLRFVESSWAEIRDGGGALLLSENVAAGSERQLGGKAPYSLWLGNADGVNIVYRGKAVDLRPHTRQKVARLTLE